MPDSLRCHLARAIHDWCLEAGDSPHVLVRDGDGTRLPEGIVDGSGCVVLNIGPHAVRGLKIDNDRMAFTARFRGATFDVTVAMEDLVAVFGKGSGSGVAFVSGTPEFFSDFAVPAGGGKPGGEAPKRRAPPRRRSPEIKAY